jgi:phage-related holin
MKFKHLAILTILSICLFAASIMMQLSLSAEHTILNAGFYSSFIDKHNLYSIPQNFVLLSIKNHTSQLDEITYQSLLQASSSTFTQEWTQEQVSGLIGRLLAYLKNDSNELDLRIDLRAQKLQFITYLLPLLVENENPGVSQQIMINRAEQISQAVGIPDYLDLRYILAPDSGVYNYLDYIRIYYPYFKYLPFILFLVLLFFSAYYLGLPSALKNMGYVLSASGLVLIIMISYISGILDSQINSHLSSYDQLLAITGTNPRILVAMFKNSILNTSNLMAIYFCLSGIFFAIMGVIGSKLQSTRHKKLSRPS